ncbi:MAG: flagellar basal body P-ring formation chaperone FlgA [Pirellulaceae bacterium]|nr:flagellar basal body P-ring formation chaperone FlgA [Pirellulaceae bacterium]
MSLLSLVALFPQVSSAESTRPLATVSIAFKEECSIAKEIVTLGDLAFVDSDQPALGKSLREIVLFTAPEIGHQRIISSKEIQSKLQFRINLKEANIRYSGAIKINLRRTQPVIQQVAAAVKTVPTNINLQADLEKKLKNYLSTHLDAPVDYTLSAEKLTSFQKQEIIASDGSYRIGGGMSPWLGRQTFQVWYLRDGQVENFPWNVELKKTKRVAYAVGDLQRGSVITEEDIAFRPLTMNENWQNTFSSEEKGVLLGMRVERGIRAGSLLARNGLKAPTLVQRNSIVNVYVQGNGVLVETKGRAKDSGIYGDMITIEDLKNRKRIFTAKVVNAGVVLLESSNTHSLHFSEK